MKDSYHQMKQQGLSLIELMIVVAIIGILAAFAIPRFQVFQAKARQSEAKQNLSAMYVLQQVYFADHDQYAFFGAGTASLLNGIGKNFDNGSGDDVTKCNSNNPIGFKLTDCRKVRYNYYSQTPYDIPSGIGDPVGRATSRLTLYSGIGPESDHVDSTNSIFPGCDTADVWTIDFTTKSLENVGIITYDGPLGKAIDNCI